MTKVLHDLDDELIEWVDQEARSSGRSRRWLIQHAIEMWKRRLEYDRGRSSRNKRFNVVVKSAKK